MKRQYRIALQKIPGGNAIYRLTRSIKDCLRRMLIPNTMFENMGFTYLGPVDGHDTENLITLLRIARDMRRPVILHVMTCKGRGYQPAQEHPKLFHGIGKFDPVTGEPFKKSQETFSSAFGSTMVELAEKNNKLCAITAAMPGGTGLLDFKQQYPKRLFDVGIAEEHAVSMAGGLAKQGMIPVVALYSTFLQRSYDMIMQDICMLGLHVVFAVDRAGLVGEDGETHHGVFDVGFLRQAPGMHVLCPASTAELKEMLRWAVEDYDGPVALRYPRGGNLSYTQSAWRGSLSDGVVSHRSGEDVLIVSYGTLVDNAMKAADILQKDGIEAAVVRLLTVSPLPIKALTKFLRPNASVVVVEETCSGSGIREALSYSLFHSFPGCRVYGMDLGEHFVTHGAIDKLHAHCGIDPESIADFVKEVRFHEN